MTAAYLSYIDLDGSEAGVSGATSEKGSAPISIRKGTMLEIVFGGPV